MTVMGSSYSNETSDNSQLSYVRTEPTPKSVPSTTGVISTGKVQQPYPDIMQLGLLPRPVGIHCGNTLPHTPVESTPSPTSPYLLRGRSIRKGS